MAVKSPNSTSYKITEKGILEYTKWIKNFLEFAREAQWKSQVLGKNGLDCMWSTEGMQECKSFNLSNNL